MFALLSTVCERIDQRIAKCEDKRMTKKKILSETEKRVSAGLALIAKEYGVKPKSAVFQRMLGLNSQQALTAVLMRGSATEETWERVLNRSWVSRDWLFDRKGEMFPRGLNPDIRTQAATIETLEGDIDVLRKFVTTLTVVLSAKIQGVGEDVIAAVRSIPYSDRGFYKALTEDIRKVLAASRGESPSAALPVKHQPSQKTG